MRRVYFVLLSLLLVLCFLLCSCDLIGSEEVIEDVGNSVVNVKLSVAQLPDSKALGTVYPVGTGEFFQYRATPQFGTGDVQGATEDWTVFSNNSSIGYFAQGTWKFEVRIVCGTKTSYGVIYSGSTTVSLNESSKTVAVVLSNVVNSEQSGTISFNISVPTKYSAKASVKIYIDNELKTPIDARLTSDNEGMNFSASLRCNAGCHNVKVEFWDTSVSYATCISAEVLSVRTVENASVCVQGSLAGSNGVTADLSVTYKKLKAIVTGADSLGINKSSAYLCTASGGESYQYQWFVDGVLCANSNNSRYTVSFQKNGIHTISCIVKSLDSGTEISVSDSMEIRVE